MTGFLLLLLIIRRYHYRVSVLAGATILIYGRKCNWNLSPSHITYLILLGRMRHATPSHKVGSAQRMSYKEYCVK